MKSRIRTYKAVPESIETPSKELAASLGLPWRGAGMPRMVIGRREWVSLPDLGVGPLHAKTDSGAWSSCLHAEDIVLSGDEQRVGFTTVDDHGRRVACNAPVTRIGRVRSSTGISRKRIFIQTSVVLPGGFQWNVLMSLSNRSDMLCPMLIGRRALSGYFLIDPQAAHLLGSKARLEQS